MHQANETVIARDRRPLSRVTLHPSYLVIERSEELCELHELLGGHGLAIISRIPIDQITGIGLVTSLFLPPLMVVRYAGCSQLSGRTLSDAPSQECPHAEPFSTVGISTGCTTPCGR